jgi:hypothetical protein
MFCLLLYFGSARWRLGCLVLGVCVKFCQTFEGKVEREIGGRRQRVVIEKRE